MPVASHRRLKPETQLLVKCFVSCNTACYVVGISSTKCKWLQLNVKHIKQNIGNNVWNGVCVKFTFIYYFSHRNLHKVFSIYSYHVKICNYNRIG